MKPLFSDNSKAMNSMVLYEKGKIIKNYKKLSQVLNKYFKNLIKSLIKNLQNVYRERAF